jgi:hypothetical protein
MLLRCSIGEDAGMTPQVFISYRAADGADKATALARNLGRHFGDAQVFLDKDDLPGGSRWAEHVAQTIDARPVVLLLMTPHLLAATDAEGRRRIERDDDPVRLELSAALAAEAHVIPVLCDGVDAIPAADTLPPPFDELGARTWRRLRSYDFNADLQRLIEDLERLGVPPLPAAAAATADATQATLAAAGAAVRAERGHNRRVWLAAGAAAVLAVVAGLSWWGRESGPAGAWVLSLDDPAGSGASEQLWVELRPAPAGKADGPGTTWQLDSRPLDIREQPAWAAYREFWLRRTGWPLDAVRYRGQGRLLQAPGQAAALEIGFRVISVPGEEDIDGGGLRLTERGDGSWAGTRWLNSVQAESPARMERPGR